MIYQLDQIIVKRTRYSNNFGHIGIHQITGSLNIGSTFKGDFKKQVNAKLNEKLAGKVRTIKS